MAKYYFLLTALPPLTLGVKPEITFKELKENLALNLTRADAQEVKQLLLPIHLYNIRALWLGLPFDERGSLGAKDLEEALLVQEGLPSYLIEFLDRYESTQDRLRYFSSLYASLYRDELPKLKGFNLKYYRFEREMRLVLLALRAKRQGRDLIRELQFEDPTDPFIAHMIAQKEAPDYTPPQEYEELKTLFVDNVSEPLKLHRAILQYRFDKVEEMDENQDFSIDSVLSYIVRLMIVESLADLDQERGKMEVEQLSQYG
ncbi:MAG TPA: DUF2764 family protein [Chlamydiales bacterium]|nr:DUF2764 family protein [Chlamydiales bacterium]